jgi:hypothetical protein
MDIVEGKVEQDAREVRTKFPKTLTTWLFPVGADIHQIVVDWVGYLTSEKLFGPVTRVSGDRQSAGQGLSVPAGGVSRQHWLNAAPIRMIFREAFTGAGATAARETGKGHRADDPDLAI